MYFTRQHCSSQGRYFLIRDTDVGDDRLGTFDDYLAPNVRQNSCDLPVYGLGQPTRNGLERLVGQLKECRKYSVSKLLFVFKFI
jgi:hypothetical protein